jgi:hypothetical protein
MAADILISIVNEDEPESFQVTDPDGYGCRLELVALPGGGQRISITGAGEGLPQMELHPGVIKMLLIYLTPGGLNASD